MRAQNTLDLELLASASGQTANEISTKIISEFVTRGFMGNSPACWGCTISECLTKGIKVLEMYEAMTAARIPNKSIYLNLIRNLVVIGNGDCPECGGEMEVEDGDYRELRGDYLSPSEFTPIWENKKCCHCGYKE